MEEEEIRNGVECLTYTWSDEGKLESHCMLYTLNVTVS